MTDDSNYFGEGDQPLDQVEDETVDASQRVRKWPQLEESPVIPLGFEDDLMVFVMPEGNIRRAQAKSVPQLLKVDIYVSRDGSAFLQNFMAPGKDGSLNFLRDAAATWFNRHCRAMGPYDRSRRERKIGVWPDGISSSGAPGVALHLGDEIWRVPDPDGPGDHVRPLFETRSVFDALRDRKGPVWVLRPPTPRPEKPCGRDAGQWVRETLDFWRFEAIGSEGLTGADVLAGWLMAALLGAAPPFRGHLLIFALAGSGKTWLTRFLWSLMSVMVEEPITAFTEPGLRAALADEAHAVIIDEAESGTGFEGGPSLIDRALDVLRPMATGDGGNRKMGSTTGDGAARAQTAQGAALLVAIRPARFGPADADRFAEIKLLPLLAEGGFKPRDDAEVAAATAKARKLAPALLGRAVHGARRYLADAALIKSALKAEGKLPRTADLVAMLAAGRRLLLFDAPLAPGDEVAAELAFWRPLLEERADGEAVSNDGVDLLSHLFAANSGQHHFDRYLKIGELVEMMLEDPDHKGWPKVLAGHGMRLERGGSGAWWNNIDTRAKCPDGHWLLVANGHPGMKALLKGTEFGDHRRTLSYLEQLGEAHRQESIEGLRFGPGPKRRSVAIPLAPWFDKAVRSTARPDHEASSPGSGTVAGPGVPGGVPAFGVEDV